MALPRSASHQAQAMYCLPFSAAQWAKFCLHFFIQKGFPECPRPNFSPCGSTYWHCPCSGPFGIHMPLEHSHAHHGYHCKHGGSLTELFLQLAAGACFTACKQGRLEAAGSQHFQEPPSASALTSLPLRGPWDYSEVGFAVSQRSPAGLSSS